MPLNMEENKVHFRHLMLFFYRKNATQGKQDMRCLRRAIAERTVWK